MTALISPTRTSARTTTSRRSAPKTSERTEGTLLLGIDIGGTHIKGAPVDLKSGRLVTERFRVPTPKPATQDAVMDAVAQIVKHFSWKGPIGCTFPGVVRRNEILTAPHLHNSWIGVSASEVMQKRLGQPVTVLNDADAAALAESRFGAGKGEQGTILMVTVGTGLGTGLVYRGVVIPNTELGHIEVNGKDAESRASNAARENKNMRWKKWARHLSDYLQRLEDLINPELLIIGGGVAEDAERFFPHLRTRTRTVAARLGNSAGIVGAAIAAGAAYPSSVRTTRAAYAASAYPHP